MFGMLNKMMGFADSKAIKEALAKGAVVVDVRSPGEFAGGHYQGSKNIPVDQIQGRADEIIKWKKTVIVCCASGGRSSSAMNILKSKGLSDVMNAGPWTNVG
ncbi:MAG: rhodanese-like domain-containing protein [Spirochaetes bacterium]|nr:rhodanese-like domain-containing protein [Spirochaetota bacterium]